MSVFQQWSEQDIPSQKHKTVLITGANSGLGFQAAKLLAKKGAKVVLACRSLEKAQAAQVELQHEVPQAHSCVLSLDLASLHSIYQCVDSFNQDHNRLDILINNAGVMAPPLSRTQEGFETQFGTNHLGHFVLTGLLLPRLEQAPEGRVVVVSSLMHRLGRLDFDNLNAEQRYCRWSAYGQSKLANLVYAKTLHRRLLDQGSSVKVMAAHPGYSVTNLQRHATATRVSQCFAQSPEQGCLPAVIAATAPELKGGEYIGPSGWFELKGKPQRAYASKTAQDEYVGQLLWQRSEELTGFRYPDVA